MEEYKSNSYKSKEADSSKKEPEKKKLERVVTSDVKPSKKSGFTKLANVFGAEDMSKVFANLVADVLIPKIKETISGFVTNGIDMLLYGDSGRNKYNSVEHSSYQNYYKRPSERYTESRSRDVYAYEDYTIPSRGEAENVLRIMRDQLNEYGLVSVADLYDLIGVRGNYTDCKYGWTDLRTAYVDRVRDGYIVKLPRAISLD